MTDPKINPSARFGNPESLGFGISKFDWTDSLGNDVPALRGQNLVFYFDPPSNAWTIQDLREWEDPSVGLFGQEEPGPVLEKQPNATTALRAFLVRVAHRTVDLKGRRFFPSSELKKVPQFHLLKMDRLEEYLGVVKDPWRTHFRLEMVEDPSLEPLSTSFSQVREKGGLWTARQHAARIRFLMNPEGAEQLLYPIEVDCYTDRGWVYPDPVVLDGWHRLMAHRALKLGEIRATFGGRVDLLNYLRGDKNSVRPSE